MLLSAREVAWDKGRKFLNDYCMRSAAVNRVRIVTAKIEMTDDEMVNTEYS